MDKGDILDELWFTGDRYTKERSSCDVAAIEKYKADIKGIFGN